MTPSRESDNAREWSGRPNRQHSLPTRVGVSIGQTGPGSVLGNWREMKTTEERFWAKVDRRGPDECWPWIGATNNRGYGQFWYGGGQRLSHRIAWLLLRGPVGDLFVLHRCDNPICVNPAHLFLGTHQDNMQDMVTKGRHAMQRHPEKAARGDRHGLRLHPERIARGDRHGSKTHPERLARGDRHGSVTHPESLRRGNNHPARLHPECLPRGVGHGMAKLSERDVLSIRLASGTNRQIADRFGIDRTTVGRIRRGVTWRHLLSGARIVEPER